MSHTAFFYGTLMAPQVLHRVIWGSQAPPTPAHASLLHIRPAVLHAHQRHKVKCADYPAVLPASSSCTVRGTLVQGLTDGDLWRLDIFEGAEYQRRKVRVTAFRGNRTLQRLDDDDDVQGEDVEAETYIWVAGAHRLDPQEWDFDEFVREKLKRWVGGEDASHADEGFRGMFDFTAVLGYYGDGGCGGRGVDGNIWGQLENGEVGEKMLRSAV